MECVDHCLCVGGFHQHCKVVKGQIVCSLLYYMPVVTVSNTLFLNATHPPHALLPTRPMVKREIAMGIGTATTDYVTE